MKTTSVRDLQHGLAAVLASVERGDTVTVTRRGRIVARIVPAAAPAEGVHWPDAMARMTRIFPGGVPPGPSPSALVRSDRDERS